MRGLILVFVCFFSLTNTQKLSAQTNVDSTKITKDETYSMKDLALKMNSEEVEVLAEEIQSEGRLYRKITWEGKHFYVGLARPQDSATGTPGEWECLESDQWQKLNLPRTDKTSRVELGAPVSKKVKIFAETLRTTCPDSNRPQKRPEIEDSNVGIKTGDVSKGQRERRLFVNPKENSLNFSTSF